MKISELVGKLRVAMAQHGDIEVVSGLSESGYGQAIIKTDVVEGTAPGADTFMKVFDITNSFETAVEQSVVDVSPEEADLGGDA
jgi:hypothetical protein